ncbi:Thiosulfate sulfurtransferase, rhodanese [hydrothermal vent metagenome]|uniref:Thiosulfate sulfurtransferase, rhodanese n=1 Tax=hydrothermal vent metagenome TaxID=652676 RepID=A0A3B0RV35_9ZZZZ
MSAQTSSQKPNADPARFLASAGWLHQHLDDKNLVIIDARFDVRVNQDGSFEEIPGRDGYEQGHIPGAQFVDLHADLADATNPTRILAADNFAALMSRLGVGPQTTVVLYDARGGVWAARLWWALRYYGHDAVKMLDGGLSAWLAADLPLQTQIQAPATAQFIAKPRPELRVEKAEVLAAIDDPAICLVDALPAPFYRGLAGLYPHHQKGHIPGAKNLPAEDNLDPKTLCIKPLQELRALWQTVDILPEQKVITYCGGGIYASFALFVLALLGHENMALYDASWMEWGQDETLPVETGRTKT